MVKRKGPLFTGFASMVSSKKLYDTDLIKQDLLNHFYTRKGERIMDPEFGTIIWDLLFELKTETTVSEIESDVIRIIATDRRVRLDQLEIIEQEHGYLVYCLLYFNELDIVDEFRVEFNQRIKDAANVQLGE